MKQKLGKWADFTAFVTIWITAPITLFAYMKIGMVACFICLCAGLILSIKMTE